METKDKILKTSFRLFLKKGFSEVSVNEIIKEANITKGGFYHYFKSKDELIYMVIDNFFCPFFQVPIDSMKSDFKNNKKFKNAKEKLMHYYTFVPSFSMHNMPCEIDKHNDIKLFYFLLFEGMKKYEYMDNLRNRFYNETIGIIEQVIEEGKEEGLIRRSIVPREWAVIINALKDGMISLNFIEESIDIRQKCILSFDLIWEEIKT